MPNEPVPPEAAAAPAATPAPAPADAATSLLLVVEDDPVLKNLLGHTFAGRYQTLYASDANQALALVDQFHPKLVLLDLVLPGLSGFDFLEKLRARADDMKGVPVLVVSNLGQQKDRERAQALGANGYLVKAESSVDEIISKVQDMLPK